MKEIYRITLSLIVIGIFLASEGQQILFLSINFLISFSFILFLGIFWNAITSFRNEALKEVIRITDLKEGTVLAEEIYTSDDEVIREEKSLFDKIKEAIKTGDLSALKRKGVSTEAAGLAHEDVELLKSYVRKGKLEDRIKIKKSMPFAPVIALGLILSLIFGDIALLIQWWIYG
jgi:preflagellin peptidase FlaK